jgi:hypothetical protein
MPHLSSKGDIFAGDMNKKLAGICGEAAHQSPRDKAAAMVQRDRWLCAPGSILQTRDPQNPMQPIQPLAVSSEQNYTELQA